MLKRLELHNHTIESDGQLTCQDLIDYLLTDQVDGFALTDHNTISGLPICERLLDQMGNPMQFIRGMEYTTYYGHILCLNLTEYVPWENVDRRHPERLFNAARAKGSLVGIAHPYSFGDPFARGCRFEMTVTDWTAVDFIEIFNTGNRLHENNEPAYLLWQEKVLEGCHLAATAGMDLHNNTRKFADCFATFLEADAEGSLPEQMEAAIRTQSTWVSRGPILKVDTQTDQLILSVSRSSKPGFAYPDSYRAVLTYKIGEEVRREIISIKEGESITVDRHLFDGASVIQPALYDAVDGIEEIRIDELNCVCPLIWQ